VACTGPTIAVHNGATAISPPRRARHHQRAGLPGATHVALHFAVDPARRAKITLFRSAGPDQLSMRVCGLGGFLPNMANPPLSIL
jgi:hypothetical protein